MNFQEYKTIEYPCRTVVSILKDGKPAFQACLTTSYEFPNKKERDYASSQFKKDPYLIKVVPWQIRRAKEKGNARTDYFVSIYWPRE